MTYAPETGAPGDNRGSWSKLSCGTYDPATGSRSGVGGFSGGSDVVGWPLACYGAGTGDWIGTQEKAAPPGQTGSRWGSHVFWRAWCQDRFSSVLDAAESDAAALTSMAAAAAASEVVTDDQVREWAQLVHDASVKLNDLVGGGIGASGIAVTPAKSRTQATTFLGDRKSVV